MSSREVGARAEAYRASLIDADKQDLIYKSQFAFIEKAHLKLGEGERIIVEQPASDVLLDIFQSFDFGRALHGALDAWIKAASKSVGQIRDEIVHLTLKDFAYLIKFRLVDEGQDLLSYLEWFFGQCLLDSVGKAVDNIPELAGWGSDLEKTAGRVEGSFDGATTKVAELYHRVRIEGVRKPLKANYRMGDIYLLVDPAGRRTLTALITPDCDLILRKGERLAPRLTTVSGELAPYNAPTSTVSNFILLREADKEVPYNIAWDPKEVRTWEYKNDSRPGSQTVQQTLGTDGAVAQAGDGTSLPAPQPDLWPAPNQSSPGYTLVGTLRPLYAQQLQRDVLHDFGRVGVPVAPAIAMAASCTVSVRKSDKSIAKIAVGDEAIASCWVVLGRASGDKPKVVFARSFVTQLLEALTRLNPQELIRPNEMSNFTQPAVILKLFEHMCRDGVPLGKSAGYGIEVTHANPKGPPDGPLCWIVVAKADEITEVATSESAETQVLQ
jgi:hypothetical protein